MGVTGLTGEATSPVIRGSRRYLFEFSFKVEFQAVAEDGTVKGHLQFPEVTDDGDRPFDVNLSFSSGPNALQSKLRPHLLGDVNKMLQARIEVFAADYANGCVKSQ